ncbi:hypothetical protein RB199_13530 [Streptomyces libani]
MAGIDQQQNLVGTASQGSPGEQFGGVRLLLVADVGGVAGKEPQPAVGHAGVAGPEDYRGPVPAFSLPLLGPGSYGVPHLVPAWIRQ